MCDPWSSTVCFEVLRPAHMVEDMLFDTKCIVTRMKTNLQVWEGTATCVVPSRFPSGNGGKKVENLPINLTGHLNKMSSIQQ